MCASPWSRTASGCARPCATSSASWRRARRRCRAPPASPAWRRRRGRRCRANFSASQMPRARPSRPPIGPKRKALVMARSPSKSENPAQPMMMPERRAAAMNPTTAPTMPPMMAQMTPALCPFSTPGAGRHHIAGLPQRHSRRGPRARSASTNYVPGCGEIPPARPWVAWRRYSVAALRSPSARSCSFAITSPMVTATRWPILLRTSWNRRA
jgi:hypothetical protein